LTPAVVENEFPVEDADDVVGKEGEDEEEDAGVVAGKKGLKGNPRALSGVWRAVVISEKNGAELILLQAIARSMRERESSGKEGLKREIQCV